MTRSLPLLLLSVLLCACPGPAAEDPGPTPTAPPSPGSITELTHAAAPTAETPLLTRTATGDVLLSWVESVAGDHELRYAWLRADASKFEAPGTAASGSDWTVYWADGPSVVPRADGGLAAHWLVHLDAGGYGGMVSMSDDGVAWTTPVSVHDDASPTEHGFFRLAPLADGRMLVTWLDGREYDGGSRETQVLTRVVNTDGSLGPEQQTDARACDCCPLDAVETGADRSVVVYRDRTDLEIRDIYAAVFDGAGLVSTSRVHADDWEIDGCPTNGPAVDAVGDLVAAMWFTIAGGDNRVLAALSTDGGLSFGDGILVDDAIVMGRASITALEDGGAVAAWVARDSDLYLMLRRIHPDGSMGEPIKLTPVHNTFSTPQPRIERFGDGLLVVWHGPSGRLKVGRTPIP